MHHTIRLAVVDLCDTNTPVSVSYHESLTAAVHLAFAEGAAAESVHVLAAVSSVDSAHHVWASQAWRLTREDDWRWNTDDVPVSDWAFKAALASFGVDRKSSKQGATMAGSNKDVLNFSLTERGFMKAEFTDYSGATCRLQESSIMVEGNAVWLGVHEHAMHLTRAQAREIAEALMVFAETGLLTKNERRTGT